MAFCPKRLQRADAYLAEQIAAGRLPGAVSSVYHHGELVHHHSQGWADIEQQVPLSDQNLFRIYSLTKIVTTVALLQLYESGSLDLNDPIAKYIPAFEHQADEASSRITIYDLLRHCSGIRKEHTVEELIASERTLESFADELAVQSLEFEPNTQWSYGYSTDLLARIIELCSGQRFDQYLSEKIFAPLAMDDTCFALSEEQAQRLCVLYRLADTGELIRQEGNDASRLFGHNSSFLSGSAGLVSSPKDYLRFAVMLLQKGRWNDVQILGRKTVELMTMNHLPVEHPLLEIGTQRFAFGLGVSIITDVAAARSLCSLGEFGWGGAAGTQVWINPEESLVVQIFIQVRADTPTGIMNNYKRLVYQALI
jgi:CubicO group peptidase (beta-lactamase class C family)